MTRSLLALGAALAALIIAIFPYSGAPPATSVSLGSEMGTAAWGSHTFVALSEGPPIVITAGDVGVVERLVEDVDAGHDGFYRHPQYHEEAIEMFFRLAL